MRSKTCRIAALAATLAAVGAMSVAAAPASAAELCKAGEKEHECTPLTFPFVFWHVSGSITAGGQKITLPPGTGCVGLPTCTRPEGSLFNGFGLVAIRQPTSPDPLSGVICGCEVPLPGGFPRGGIFIPSFTSEVEFPAKSGEHQIAQVSVTETPNQGPGCSIVSPLSCTLHGEFNSTLASFCPSPLFGPSADCVHETFSEKVALGYSVHGPGEGLPSKTVSQCETVEPVKLELEHNLTFEEVAFVGTDFTGTTTIPPYTCSGRYGEGRGRQMTEDFSGPASYNICVTPPSETPGVPVLPKCT